MQSRFMYFYFRKSFFWFLVFFKMWIWDYFIFLVHEVLPTKLLVMLTTERLISYFLLFMRENLFTRQSFRNSLANLLVKKASRSIKKLHTQDTSKYIKKKRFFHNKIMNLLKTCTTSWVIRYMSIFCQSRYNLSNFCYKFSLLFLIPLPEQ